MEEEQTYARVAIGFTTLILVMLGVFMVAVWVFREHYTEADVHAW